MENASKALLIAASILIVIVLIAIGMKLLSSSTGVTDEVEDVSDAMSISIFNSQFTDYVGRQTGTQVKTVLSKAATTYRNGSSRTVSVKVEGGAQLTNRIGIKNNANGIAQVISALSLNSTYTVGVEYDSNGYICMITING